MSTRAKLTQTARLLRWARLGHPLHQDDWYAAPAPDGGAAVKALRSRIADLERQGYRFEHRRRERSRMWEYRLLEEPDAARPQDVAGAPDRASVAHPLPLPSRMYDPWDEAA